jgi:hypothetical protein
MSSSNTNAMLKGASDSNKNSNNPSSSRNKLQFIKIKRNNSRKGEPDLLNDDYVIFCNK